MLYVHQYPDWTHFHYDTLAVMNALGLVRYIQGQLIGLAKICNINELEEKIITDDIVANFAIDGTELEYDSILNDVKMRSKASRNFVINSLGVIQNANSALTIERIFNWHGALSKKNPFRLRTTESKISRTVSNGDLSFEGPHYENIAKLVENFLSWFETSPLDGLVKAAIAEFWFLTIRPFEEGNGKIARMISTMQLVRSGNFNKYVYPVHRQYFENREQYFSILNKVQRSNGNITEWILWYLRMLQAAMEKTLQALENTANRIRFQQRFAKTALDIREQMIVDAAMTGRLPQHFSAKEVGALLGASHDTALRAIQSLIAKGVFKAATKGGRSQKYCLV